MMTFFLALGMWVVLCLAAGHWENRAMFSGHLLEGCGCVFMMLSGFALLVYGGYVLGLYHAHH